MATAEKASAQATTKLDEAWRTNGAAARPQTVSAAKKAAQAKAAQATVQAENEATWPRARSVRRSRRGVRSA